MSDYQLTWITDRLAVGHAPMSYEDLDLIRAEGIDAIVNLCGEFCDLHEIEEKSGFEVYYLPIPDESAPDMADMEDALAWLDEAIYLGKKILVHCRHGIGRTGTFVTSYLLRKGLGLKVAGKKLKGTRANPTNYSQWRLLKKYSKKSGILKIREPSLENNHVVDLSIYFTEYEALVHKIDEDLEAVKDSSPQALSCGAERDDCCYRYIDLDLIEAIYLSNTMNRLLGSDVRNRVIHTAVKIGQTTKKMIARLKQKGDGSTVAKEALVEAYAGEKILCALNNKHRCALYKFRPLSCRLHGVPAGVIDQGLIAPTLRELSRSVFFSFSGLFLDENGLSFSLADTISGKFVQEYFYCLASLQKK
jgi:Fe-S-cluster containining protein